jgi:hypothetical protein
MTSPNASMSTIAVPPSGENYVDALSGGVRWGGVEPIATVAYSFAFANGPAFWAPDSDNLISAP